MIDASAGHVVKVVPTSNVYELGFSPFGTYLSTWQRPSKDENGDAVKNLKVWSVGTTKSQDGEETVGQFVQKSQTGWNLQYTSDEVYCARSVNNEVQFYQGGDLSNASNRLRVEGLTDFALSHGKDCSVAVFVPERKVDINAFQSNCRLISLGSTCCRKSLQISTFRVANLSKDLF